jgi:hypothetical protein
MSFRVHCEQARQSSLERCPRSGLVGEASQVSSQSIDLHPRGVRRGQRSTGEADAFGYVDGKLRRGENAILEMQRAFAASPAVDSETTGPCERALCAVPAHAPLTRVLSMHTPRRPTDSRRSTRPCTLRRRLRLLHPPELRHRRRGPSVTSPHRRCALVSRGPPARAHPHSRRGWGDAAGPGVILGARTSLLAQTLQMFDSLFLRAAAPSRWNAAARRLLDARSRGPTSCSQTFEVAELAPRC